MRGKQWLRIPFFALVVTAVAVALSGCLFEPREPAPPSLGNQVTYNPQTSPSNVWENLQISLRNNDSFGWEENISPDFIYEPDDQTLIDFGDVFAEEWNFEREKSFINSFYTTGPSIEAQMRNDDFNVPEPDGTEVEWLGVIYFLTVTDPNDGSQISYSASADITFTLEGNFWYVNRWRDLIGENDPDTGQELSTMGVLRGTFGSN